MPKEPQKPIPKPTELLILDMSRHRCGDLTEKKGQIAHPDQNPANVSDVNPAWLYLEHHHVV
jgi:hypothetical protein